MGYDTKFEGSITIEPPLNPQEIRYLTEFSETRHWNRREGAYALTGWNSPSFHDNRHNTPPQGVPGLWCKWAPTDDGTALEWNGAEKFYDAAEWMDYLITTFLRPGAVLEVDRRHPHPHWDYPEDLKHFTCDHALNGYITAQGEDPDDQWTLIVKDNDVTRRNGHPPFDAAHEGRMLITLTHTFEFDPNVLWATGQAPTHPTAADVAARFRHKGEELFALLRASTGTPVETAREARAMDDAGNTAPLETVMGCTTEWHTHTTPQRFDTCRDEDAPYELPPAPT